jgi:PAS domain S-box-containing protein
VAPEDISALNEWPAEAAAGDWGEALRASEQRFRREFGRSPVGMLVTSLTSDHPNTCLTVNEALCELSGYTARELSRGDFLGDYHPDDQPALEALLQGVISGGTGEIQADARLVRKDGEIVCVHLTGSAIQPPAGERYLSIFVEDTSALAQAQAEIGRLEQELRQSHRMESVGQLVGGLAHDFNNLLTVIGNYASLVRDEVSVAEATESAARWEPVRWDVEQIEDAADRAKRLIKHLLAFAQREEGRPVLVDFGQLIEDECRLLREMLGERVPLVARQGASLWPVQADPGLLEQVIMNIVVNARDAMPAGGRVTIETANIDTAIPAPDRPVVDGPGVDQPVVDRQDVADLAELLPGRYVELRITDTGTGMDAVTAERAFEAFFTTKSGDQAAGLGLSAVSRFAARAGGRAWLQSSPGQGTTVTVILPAAPGSGSGATGPAAARPAMVPGHAGSVLVVDDEAAIRDVAHRVLTSAGYRVLTAANGQEALDLLENPETPVDVLLTDVVMPGMTGGAFAARIKAVRPGIRVLFMSGYQRPRPGERGAGENSASERGASERGAGGHSAGGRSAGGSSLGADGWPESGTPVIEKPFTRAALLARITQVMAEGISGDRTRQPEQHLVRVRRR